MPIMDGLEATRLIRQAEEGTGRHLPILAMTAYAMQEDRDRCLRAGMDRYIAKPFRPRELCETVEAMANQAQGGGTPAGAVAAADLIDWPAVLEHVGGDRRLLDELVAIFFRECPRWLAQLHRATAAGDALEIKRAAHNLKSAMSHFGARTGHEAALRVENLARNGTLDGIEAACAELENQIEQLKPLLEAFTRTETP
jgi:CheY-like chemotaxis protein